MCSSPTSDDSVVAAKFSPPGLEPMAHDAHRSRFEPALHDLAAHEFRANQAVAIAVDIQRAGVAGRGHELTGLEYFDRILCVKRPYGVVFTGKAWKVAKSLCGEAAGSGFFGFHRMSPFLRRAV
jgi:hypothetical protein